MKYFSAFLLSSTFVIGYILAELVSNEIINHVPED